MKIYEYQAKELFLKYGIAIPRAALARSADEARSSAAAIGVIPVVIKAQVHAGGRGKAGGIKLVDDLEKVAGVAAKLLSSRLVTAQTGAEGRPVHSVLVEESLDIARELYVGLTVDRACACVALLASDEGGIEIEKVARDSPEKLVKETIDPGVGLRPFQASRLSYALGFDGKLSKSMSAIIMGLYRLFTEKDCSNVEVNPLVQTRDGRLIALDAKINFDDDAIFRHPDIASLEDPSQEDPLEVEAQRYNLNYVKLRGNVGCMVNGAGLAMATMDLIKLMGAEPANFLDVGGGATSEMIRQGLRILLSDKDVKVVFINIFGGILRCDTLAKGVTEAARELGLKLPVVIRLAGTNVEEGRKILAESGLSFSSAGSMKEAAALVSALLKQAERVQGPVARVRQSELNTTDHSEELV